MRPWIILDANLAVLLAIGTAGRSLIANHRRTERKYDISAFNLLLEIIGRSSGLIFTPNVLTETSNLIRQAKGSIRVRCSFALSQIISNSSEKIIYSRVACGKTDYLRLGLTDAVLLSVASSGGELLTDDLDLYFAAEKAKIRVWNFTRLRDELGAFD
jgi:hypothetical protein